MGRHALLAASQGAQVVAVDRDADRVRALAKEAGKRNLAVDATQADLATWRFEPAAFDIVMVFNYLDRDRFGEMVAAVKPGGFFLAETFLEAQRMQGWGPTQDAHLLKTGELSRLVGEYELILGREVIEMIDGRPAALASVLAQRAAQ